MTNKKSPRVSILTPSWNRAEFLSKVYKSLCLQSYSNFEWNIVDDGSSDDTESVMLDLIGKATFPITFARFPHRAGKSRADNTLLDLASGKFVIWCDSDDILNSRAIDSMLAAWSRIPFEEKENCIGVIGMCADINGIIQSTGGNAFVEFMTTWGDLGRVHGMRGDMCIMLRRDIIGTHRFHEHDLVMPESGFWHQFMSMKVVCLPDVLKVMNRDTENRISGSSRMEYCRGKAYAIVYADSGTFHERTFWGQLNLANRYHRYSIHGDLSFSERNSLFTGKKTLAYYAGLIPGVILAWKDILQGHVVKSHRIFEEGKSAKLTVKRNALAAKLWESNQ